MVVGSTPGGVFGTMRKALPLSADGAGVGVGTGWWKMGSPEPGSTHEGGAGEVKAPIGGVDGEFGGDDGEDGGKPGAGGEEGLTAGGSGVYAAV